MTTTVQFIGSMEAVIAAVVAHWRALGIDADWLEAAEPAQSGTTLWWSTERPEGRVRLVGTLSGKGQPLTDAVVPDSVADIWMAPLASVETLAHLAERRDVTMTLPAAGGVALVNPRSPNSQLAGFPKPKPAENAPDAPEPLPWAPRTPGVANGYPLGAFAMHGGDRWYQGATVPAADPVALNGGNYNEPGTLNSGWVKVFQPGTTPAWEADTQYLAGQTVSRPNGRLYKAKLAEYALLGREPENPVMHAVWEDVGPAEGGGGGEGPEAWAVGQSVAVDDERTDGGRLYRALQAHTTQAGWEPANVPALWEDIGPAP